MSTAPTCIIAYTTEDDRYTAERQSAIETARGANARLILYAIDTATVFGSSLPTAWSGEGEEQLFKDELSADALERAGRHALADQVRQARGAGVRTTAWLPESKGADALAKYAGEHGADLIMMPEELEDPSLADRLRGNSVEKAVASTHIPIAVIDREGEVHYRQQEA